MSNSQKTPLSQTVKNQAQIIGGFIVLFWAIEILDVFVFDHRLKQYGIVPHSLIGLRGILFSPFLHDGFGHLIGNTIPFIILGWLVMIQETTDFWIVTIITMIVGGLGVWVFAPSNTVHIGASGIIFGYLGFLLFRGYFQRNLASILLSLVVGFLYGGLIWGVLPTQPDVSWQWHLFGFIGGALAAKIVATEKRFYS